MSYPKLSIAQASTYRATFEEDLKAYRDAGIDGIGLWEFKLPDEDDGRLRDMVKASGLEATLCVPRVPSIIPDTLFPSPTDARERRDALCAAVRRLAAFEPVAVMVLPGDPGEDRARTRRIVVDGLKAAADAAGEAGVLLGLEPLRTSAGSLVTTLPETVDMIGDIGADNVRIIYDTWHFWDLPDWRENTVRHVDRLIGVQINDWPADGRGWCDRRLPGDGIIDLPHVFGTLEEAGFAGWYDVEILSDDGRFGADYPDSLWKLPPHEFARRCVETFRAAWDRRSASPAA